jgi:hypothetical protein
MADAAVTEKAFDEFHLYALPRPVTLRDREAKQVEFMRATGVKAPVIYVYDGAEGLVRWRVHSSASPASEPSRAAK